MMVLSRIWYVVLALVAAACLYVVSLAVGQYNRSSGAATGEALKGDSQVVGWALQIDARRRLDNLLLGTVDENVRKALRAANGKDSIPTASKDDGRKGLTSLNEKLPADYKFSMAFVVDREGRVISQVGYDKGGDFELGGFPAVFDALHGFLRDDTWSFGGSLYRVVARPVEDEVGQQPLGAVVGVTEVNASYTKELCKRTRANVLFYVGAQKIATGKSDETLDEAAFANVTTQLGSLVEDATYTSSGRSDVRDAGADGKLSSIFARLPGDAGVPSIGAGFAVLRQKTFIAGIMGFLSGADDTDKKNVSYILILSVLFAGALFGLLFSFLEHSLPMRELRKQATDLRSGKLDTLQLSSLRAGYRSIGLDLNQGIERIVEKGGGLARKPADLESILGPVPAQPQMSAFSFPEPSGVMPASSGTAPGSAPRSSNNLAPPAPRTAPLSAAKPAAAPKPPPPKPAGLMKPASKPGAVPEQEDQDEPTRVGDASAHLASDDPSVEWRRVYEEFINVKKQCGEPTEGLTFEKFQVTLTKNRDALMQKHNCSRVRFAVHIKDGRASLKATPVRD